MIELFKIILHRKKNNNNKNRFYVSALVHPNKVLIFTIVFTETKSIITCRDEDMNGFE